MIQLVVVIDWEPDKTVCRAKTYGSHFLAGATVALSNTDPSECLEALAKAWRKIDQHHSAIIAIDNEVEP